MKLTAAIAHSYPNAEVRFMDIDNIDKVAKIDGIVKDTVHLGIPCNLISLPIEHKFISVEYCQLILTPFNNPDEDAVEVARIALSMCVPSEITDYLRSKNYDCGHGSIPNLIAAGVAVEKEQI